MLEPEVLASNSMCSDSPPLNKLLSSSFTFPSQMPRHSRYPAFPNNNQLYTVINNFQRFSTRLSLVTVLSLGIHPHPHMQTFKAKNKTDIKAIKQNSNIRKGCVYKACVPFTFYFTLLRLSRLDCQARQPESTGHVFPSSDYLGT